MVVGKDGYLAGGSRKTKKLLSKPLNKRGIDMGRPNQ